MYYQKHYTLQEARDMLPDLRIRLNCIRKMAFELESAGFDIYRGNYKVGFHPDSFTEFPEDYKKLRKLIKEIISMGIEIKNIEHGLIDFPTLRPNGEEVFLCWKIEEHDIEFWHRIEDGYKGRQHIDEF